LHRSTARSTTPYMTTANSNSNSTAAELAARSGLFAQSKNPPAPSSIDDSANARFPPPGPADQPQPAPAQRKSADSSPPPDNPQPAQDVDRGETGADQGTAPDSGQVPEPDELTESLNSDIGVFDLIKLAASKSEKLSKAENSAVFTLAKRIRRYVDRLHQRAQAAEEKSRTYTRASKDGEVEPVTRAELINIITQEIRKTNRTGSDVKGLAATLQSLLPDLFADSSKAPQPDPCAVLAYVCSFSGMTGAEIVHELGGRDWMSARLRDILKTSVILPDPVD